MTTEATVSGTTLPAFDRIRAGEVEPTIRALLERNRAEVATLESQPNPTFENTVLPLEQLAHRLSRTWSPIGHLNGVLNSEELRASYNACLPLLSNYWTDLAQSEPLFRAYSAIAANESGGLAPAQRRVIERALEDFRLAGVGLPPDRKARYKTVVQELAQLGAKFEENVLDAMNAWTRHVTDAAELAGINPVIVEQARVRATEKGMPGWLFALEQPTYVAVMTDADSETLRRDFYEAWTTRASEIGPGAGKFDNTDVMEKILALRHEAARLLDFPNYAAYALATRMAPSTQAVFDFLHELARVARPAARKEFAELEQFAGRRLNAWDVTYFAEKLQSKLFAISQEELRPYFPLPRVLEGLFSVAGKLFGVKIVERAGIPVYHPDARFFEIQDASGTARAGFYLDACARAKKRAGAWMDDCVGRKDFGDAPAVPVAYLVCNFLPAAPGKPPLLTHDDVVTMFHEFGHGLHHMLTRVGYPSIAGINGVSWDAVELPSQFLENFAWRSEVLDTMARHFETGEPLPADKKSQLLGSRTFHAGLATMRQLEFALFDFRLHAEYDPSQGARVAQIIAEVRREVGVFDVPAWNRMPNNFGHIFAGGYAAGYYSYKWAEVLAADAFAAFEEQGVFDREVAQRFLDSILSQGGSKKALDAFVDFRGRPPDVNALLKQQGLGDMSSATTEGGASQKEFSIATWNVNSLRVRGEQVLQWLRDVQPDVLALQETKMQDPDFPHPEFTAAGYHSVFSGQKSYNGVALLSRLPMTDFIRDIPDFDDPPRRVLAATIGEFRVINLYVPNGQAPGSEKFAYKLRWLEALTRWLKNEAAQHPGLVVLGDFNVAPEDRDVHDPAAWVGCVHVSPEERAALQAITGLGLVDTFRQFEQPEKSFSWWDYRQGGFRRNNGLRIDLILAHRLLLPRLASVRIDVDPRRAERASDHTPVIATFVGGAVGGAGHQLS